LLAAEKDESIATTAVNFHELLYGYSKLSRSPENLLGFQVIPFRRADALLSASIEAGLEQEGSPVEREDTMIAATVINNGGRLFTFNQKHYRPMMKRGLELFAEQPSP
jgi:predicted nucleic acid-binding protein